MDIDKKFIIIVIVIICTLALYRVLVYTTRLYLFKQQAVAADRPRRRENSAGGSNRGGQELNTVSRQAELRELPPDYNKVGGMPPPYDLVVAGNPPAYDDAIQMEAHSCNLSQLSSLPSPLETSTPTDLACVVVVPTSSQHTLPTPIHTSAAASAACRSPPPQQL